MCSKLPRKRVIIGYGAASGPEEKKKRNRTTMKLMPDHGMDCSRAARIETEDFKFN